MVTPFFEVLSTVDAQLWRWDTVETPMNMGNVCLFEGERLLDESGRVRLDDIRGAIESRLHLVPRYRRKLIDIPLGRPILVDDPSFDIANHVQSMTLDPPGSLEQVKAAFSQVHEGVLERDRPLWKIVFVDGLADGRVGMIQKIHHAPFDGATTVRILESLLDDGPEAVYVAGPPYEPRPHPNALQIATGSIRQQLSDTARVAKGPYGPTLNPRRAFESTRTMLALRHFLPATRTSLNRPVGPKRRFDWVTTTLGEVKRMRSLVDGATLNDVMLAAVSGGLRALWSARGEDLTRIVPRVFVPVDVRDPEQAAAQPGNHFSAMVPTMPITEPDVVQRLRSITTEMARLKAGRQAEAVQLAMHASDVLSPAVVAAAGWKGHNRGMFMNLTVTNVPGPRKELYLLGAKMLELHPMLPIGNLLTLNVAVESYAGKLSVGICSDPESVPDLDVFTTAVRQAFDDLLSRAG